MKSKKMIRWPVDAEFFSFLDELCGEKKYPKLHLVMAQNSKCDICGLLALGDGTEEGDFNCECAE